MNENKEFEHKIDPDLWAEIEEWEKTDHDEQAMMLTVAGLVIVLMMLIPAIDELFGTIRSVFGLW